MQALFRKSASCGNLSILQALRNGGITSSSVSSSLRFYPALAPCGTQNGEIEPEKSVFISQSTDIHTNLALEDWLYRNFDFNKHRVLLLWRNDPCVVIGRHQNPWSEVDVDLAEEKGLNIARRNSGGGCVYHDRGNLNCTFFTQRNGYDRKSNLEIICRALERQFGIKADISPRLDVNLDGYKISGTASKLGKNAYHHCTVLVDADLKKLSALLNPNTEGMDCRATKSIKSPVQNVRNVNNGVSLEKVLSSIGYEFLRTTTDGNDGGAERIQKQRGFQMVNPTNDWFPGLDSIKSELKSWAWNFGKTPEFSLRKEYQIGQDLTTLEPVNIQLNLEVKKGMVQTASLDLPVDKRDYVDEATFSDLSGFINAIKERQFNPGFVSTFEDLLFKTSKKKPVSIHETVDDNRKSIRNS